MTSTHRGALNRQVTEAVKISNEGLGSLLNSKNEFGSNNLSEIAVRKGNYMVGGEPKRKREEGEEEKKEEQTVKEEGIQERRMKVPVKSMVMREPKEVKAVKIVAEEKGVVEEEELVESFKRMKVDGTRYMTLVKHEGNEVEVEANQERRRLVKSTKTPPKLPQSSLKVLKVKGIDNMTVKGTQGGLEEEEDEGIDRVEEGPTH